MIDFKPPFLAKLHFVIYFDWRVLLMVIQRFNAQNQSAKCLKLHSVETHYWLTSFMISRSLNCLLFVQNHRPMFKSSLNWILQFKCQSPKNLNQSSQNLSFAFWSHRRFEYHFQLIIWSLLIIHFKGPFMLN